MRLLVFCTTAIIIIACGGDKKPDTDVHGKAIFHYNEASGISSLDPAFARNLEEMWVVHQMYNGLVQMDEHLNILPCIARSWHISPDGLVYTFKLRTDVRFHDDPAFPGGKGRTVVAGDFVKSFFRIIDPEVASYGRYYANIFDISENSNYKGFVALNDSTLQLFLNKPFQPLLGVLTMPYFSVVPEEIVRHYGKEFRRHPVGTGPFVFKAWNEDIKLVLQRNDHYFELDDEDQSLPYLDGVAISFIKSPEVMFMEFQKGNLDMLSGLYPSFKDQVLTPEGQLTPKMAAKYKLQKYPYLTTEYLGIQSGSAAAKGSPLSDLRIRKAIAYSIDREKMVHFIRNNKGIPAHRGFVPPEMYQDTAIIPSGYQYNPELAEKMLEEAGYPGGKGLPEIVISTTATYKELMEYIQFALGETGIKVKINIMEPSPFRVAVAQGNIAIFRKSWIADYPDAESFLSLFYSENLSPSGPNYTHFSDTAYDRLYRSALAAQDMRDKESYYTEMDSILMKNLPVIPLVYDEVFRLLQPGIEGMDQNPMNLLELKKVVKQR